MPKLAQMGDFCPDVACPAYGKALTGQEKPNLIKFGRSRQGRQRYRCKTCGQAFCATTGILFHNRKIAEGKIIECLGNNGEEMHISSISRVRDIKEDTILNWLRSASAHTEAIEAVLLAEYELSCGQLDGLWSYVGNKGEKDYPETANSGQFWRSTMIEIGTRLRTARGIAKNETETATVVFETLKERGHPTQPPPTVSDGWAGNQETMAEVYGQVPKYQG